MFEIHNLWAWGTVGLGDASLEQERSQGMSKLKNFCPEMSRSRVTSCIAPDLCVLVYIAL